ncbi:MAG TPA: metal-dependent hydrolase [Thermodesulfovibrionales bacterium]|nr:metal-dependent hydrolase [Thermodesulfovibrionales bacterium]
MDPVTHALTGAAINQLGFKRKAALAVLLISSLAPDLDYISRLWGADVFLRYHRGITHGIAALFIVPVIIAIIFGYKKGFFYYFSISLLGYGAHLLMDLTTQYGTRIMSPLDWEPYSLDLTFIVDPHIVIGLLVCVILGWKNKKRAPVIAAVTLILMVSYFGARHYLHDRAKAFLKTRLDANTYKMCPLPNDFLRWWFVTKSGDEFMVGFADLFTQRVCVQERYKINPGDPFIKRSEVLPAVKNFLYFAKHPYADVRKEGDKTVVVWRELSFSFRAGDHFVMKVIFDKHGKVLHSEFYF